MKFPLFIGFFILFLCHAGMGIKKVGPLQMELVFDQNGLQPNSDCWIGWRIIRNPGWHTYWKHPGDVGVPPRLEWDLPKGFKSFPMIYALPEKVKMGTIRANGNYGETLFLTKIKVPGDIKAGDLLTFRAKASWLTCSRQCLPGFADLMISLDVVDNSVKDSYWHPKFEKVKNSQPRPISKNWNLNAVQKGNLINLTLKAKTPFASDSARPIFFCSNRLIRSDGKQLFMKEKNLLRLQMERSEWANKNESFLSGLIFKQNGWGDQALGNYRSIHVPLIESK